MVHRNEDVAFLEAALTNSDGVVFITATATGRVNPLSEARTGA